MVLTYTYFLEWFEPPPAPAAAAARCSLPLLAVLVALLSFILFLAGLAWLLTALICSNALLQRQPLLPCYCCSSRCSRAGVNAYIMLHGLHAALLIFLLLFMLVLKLHASAMLLNMQTAQVVLDMQRWCTYKMTVLLRGEPVHGLNIAKLRFLLRDSVQA